MYFFSCKHNYTFIVSYRVSKQKNRTFNVTTATVLLSKHNMFSFFFVCLFIFVWIYQKEERKKPQGKLTYLIWDALTGRWTDAKSDTNTWLTATLEHWDSCRHVRQTDKQTGTRRGEIRHLLTDRATVSPDRETDRKTSRMTAEEEEILLSLQAGFEGCSTSWAVAVDGLN